jgi:Na+/H+-dicarboxylate symporter
VSAARVLLALIVGLALGAGAAAATSATLIALVPWVEAVGTVWINSIRMTVIPLVVALVITGVLSTADVRRVGRLGARAVPVFLILLLVSGLFAALVAPIALDRLSIPSETAASLRASAAASAAAAGRAVGQVPSLLQRIVDFVPVNPVKAAADAAMLPLVVFTLLFALALTRLETARRLALVQWFQAVADAMMVLVGWVLALAPVGIFGLALGLGFRMGVGAAGALLHYVVTMSLALLAFTAVLYPIAALLGRTPVRRFAAAVAPAQAVGFSSRSSLASLPAQIVGARDRLHLPLAITGFVLPFAVSVFRLNVPIAWVVGVLFLGKLYGVAVGGAALAGLVVTSTLLSFSAPGIPSGSLFLLAPVLVNLGLPSEGVGILIAVDGLPDLFKTLTSVTGHMAAATILAKYSQ